MEGDLSLLRIISLHSSMLIVPPRLNSCVRRYLVGGYLRNKRAGISDEDAYANKFFEKDAAEYAANVKEAIKNTCGRLPCDKYKP